MTIFRSMTIELRKTIAVVTVTLLLLFGTISTIGAATVHAAKQFAREQPRIDDPGRAHGRRRLFRTRYFGRLRTGHRIVSNADASHFAPRQPPAVHGAGRSDRHGARAHQLRHRTSQRRQLDAKLGRNVAQHPLPAGGRPRTDIVLARPSRRSVSSSRYIAETKHSDTLNIEETTDKT